MSIGYRVLSLLVIVAGSTVTFSAAQGLGQDCTLLSGGPGVCRRITECPEVAQFAHRREVKFCGTRGRLALVCCPRDSTSCPSTGNNDGIAAPVVNFECGRQATRAVSFPGGLLSRRRRQSLFGQSIGIGAPEAKIDAVVAVVGGITAQISTWPWMALLGELDSTKTPDWFCAGSLINDQWILTAAHCLDSRTPESYTRRTRSRPRARPNPGQRIANVSPLSRLGKTQSGGHRSSTLQEVQVKVFPSSTCHAQYKDLTFFNRVWPSGIAGETMCAGTTAGGKDACQGDSGGPAVHFECNRYTLAGVISKGYDCGLRDFAGLYVNVRQLFYLQWIKQIAF
ncbi:clotting factor B-like [Penaeus monodon]|uniref:clotting factor B-like n=1 Tax=Penaeus monodon TaxID=6687 RepID=UPI0018A704AD|nr:clotting factor B-like [Penaeus monodon]